jgi:hypothetical protein
MKRKFLLLLAGSLLINICAISQPEPLYYLDESFENPQTRAQWISFPADPQIKWSYMKGGYNSTPVMAFDGDTNAILQRNDFESFTRILISPPINLENSVKPLLSFAHAQYPFFFGQDELRLLFRVGTEGSWDTILVRTEPVEMWDELFFNIDEYGTKYLAENFYLGFSGTTNSGNGVCIDKVVIEEKGLIPKFIRNFSVENLQHGIIPSGITDIPLVKVYLEVFGNIDSLKLNSITFSSTGSDDNVFESDGFELFATTSNEFRNIENSQSTKIGPTVSIASGNVTFTNINYWLKTGRNYVWLTADIKPDRFTHGHTIDFKLMQNSISISDTLLPISEVNPTGDYRIEESVFIDNFETIKGWDLDYDFEIGTPQGFIIGYTRDPGYSYSGQKVIGTDLSENGAYLMNIDSANAYFATTPLINLKYFIDTKLHMKTWNGFDALDNATIDVSVDNGATWNSIWVNDIDGLQAESRWNDLLFTDKFDTLVRKNDSVLVRFSINYSDNQFALSGWNIDNFAITGNHLDTDIDLTRIISPYDDCFGSNNDTVKIVVRNNAEGPSPATIPVYFALYGESGARVYDTIPGPLASNDSIVFVFTQTANFPGAGDYNQFIVSIDLPGDEDTTNNSLSKPIYIQRTIIPPFTEDFEENGGFWRATENSSWECMQPDGSIPVIPESPTSWIESPYGGYSNDDISIVVSSCYDLTHDPDLIIELKYWLESDQGNDGMNIQYTSDNGNTWNVLNTKTPYGTSWGWFTESVAALGDDGWTGNTVGWKVAKEFLPVSLLTKEKVQFRAYWASDDAINGRGAALDDFKIYPAPPDVGVSSIELPVNECLNQTGDQVSVYVENYGLNKISAGDTLLMGYKLESQPSVYDTLFLSSDLNPGESVQFTFNEQIEFLSAGSYQLYAFTLFEADPWFYNANNDTSVKTIEVYPLPYTGLPDTIQSREPDTVVLRAYKNPDYSYLWEGGMSTADTLKVPGDGVFHLLVTDVGGNGCTAFDSVYVELLYSDIGIDTIVSPVSSCELSESEQIVIRIKNFGNDSIIANSKIALSYILDGGSLVSDTLLLSGAFYSDETIIFPFTDKYEDFSSEGIHNLRLFSYYGGDTVRYNDTLNLNIEVFGYPVVDIGGDKVVEALTYPLDAGPGFNSYLWEDGDTLQIHIADETGLYYVRAIDTHGCPGYDTAFIRLKIRDVSPSMLVYPASACNIPGNVNVQIQAINAGNDTIPQNSNIYFKYRMGSQPIISESLSLSSPLYPHGTINHTFTNTENLNTYGDYNFMLFANTGNDLNPANDTLYDTIQVYPAPDVDFGLEDPCDTVAKELILDAGYGAYYEYQWQDGHDEQTYTVTTSGIYRVTVTDTRTGCYGNDNITIYLITPDISIANIDLTEDICSGIYNNVEIKISNPGNQAIGIDDDIYVRYYLDEDQIGYELIPRDEPFDDKDTLNYQLNSAIDLSETGNKVFMIYSILDQDLIPENDTLTLNLSIIQSPVVDFGDDNGYLQATLPHDLNAGAGHKSYLWQDSSTDPVYTVTNPGIYSVTVTGNNDCQTIKTVRVNIGTYIHNYTGKNIQVDIYPNPANDIINLELDMDGLDDLKLEIINAKGQIIYNSKLYSDRYYRGIINISDYSKGIYYIKISNSEIIHISKVIIF